METTLRATLRTACLAGAMALLVAAAPSGVQVASAQTAGPAPTAKAAPKPAGDAARATGTGATAAGAPRDPARAQRGYDAGVAAYKAGRHDEAIDQLNVAVRAGGLPSATLARALYYRGAAFQAKGKPGQAISDLTSALWFKGGLDATERADAQRIRAEAYTAAGLDPSGAPADPPAATVATAPAPKAPAPAALGGGASTFLTNLFGGGTSQPAAPAAAPAPEPPAAAADPASAPALAAVLSETATPPTPSLGLPNVFGPLFGGSTTPPAAPAPAPRTSETAALGPQTAVSSSPATTAAGPVGEPEVLPWLNGPATVGTPKAAAAPAPGGGGGAAAKGPPPAVRTVAAGEADAAPAARAEPRSARVAQTAAPAAPAAAPKTAPPAKTPARGAAGFRIQVAAVKSEAEAGALVQKLRADASLGAGVSVDPMTFGGKTIYRVRLGPYATAEAARTPCTTLKRAGLDCLVTPQ
jgi:hypothetical protein